MSSFFWNILAKIVRALLSLRYRIHVKGLESLKDLEGGILFLPNHPAHMDPLFLFLLLWPKYKMRPIVIEYVYRLPLLKYFMKLVRAISVPSLDSSINALKVKRANEALSLIVKGLKEGENIVLYPAGRLKNSGKEILGGASGAHSVIQECKNAHVVLVRTTGLWGSSFSRAILGRSPDLPTTLWHGVKVIFKNLIFFAPRRDVYVEIEPLPENFPKNAGRLTFNRHLENWFNKYPNSEGKTTDTEPATLVSYSRWKKEIPTLFQPKERKKGDVTYISNETKSRVFAEIRRILNSPEISVTPQMNLAVDLGMDSLNMAELSTFLLKSYKVEEIHPEDLETVQSVLELAEGAKTTPRPAREMGKTKWPEKELKSRPLAIAPEGNTIPEAFLHSCARMGSHAACGDDLIGVISYKKMKQSALVLSAYFRKFPEKNIGVLLPATSGTYIVILAILFADKTPVMLNWTLGPRYLEDMVQLGEVKKVVSSWKFLDRLSHVDLGSVVDMLVLLEDIRGEIGLGMKLKGAFLALRSVKKILKSLDLHTKTGNEAAVILFTSGTEASPKGVPLTHKNILKNERSAMQCLDFSEDDVLYGILPPFHSFGFSVAGLFPICGGIRIAFYPDPTDGVALAEGVDRWKVTLFCSPPSFLKGLFAVSKPEQLQSVRYFVCGAEKTPQALIEKVEKTTNAKLIEGYGITECSPILTLTREGLPHIGVGQPIPDVEMCMIHPETKELLKDGEDGEICVHGPNVFHGYLGKKSDPFIEINGKKWYRTGDLGHFDENHNLILSGRRKRFTKIGGEMISLGAIEEVLNQHLRNSGKITGEMPALALIAKEEEEGKPLLILFATIYLDKEEVNEILRETGFSRLAKIALVKQIDEIPLMGTGKTDYRRLQSYVTEAL